MTEVYLQEKGIKFSTILYIGKAPHNNMWGFVVPILYLLILFATFA